RSTLFPYTTLFRSREVPCATLVHDDLRRREHRGDVAGAPRVIEMDVRDHDGGQVAGADPQPGEGIADDRRGWRGSRLHQARPVTPDQVAGGDPVVPGHPGVDLEHLVPERYRAVSCCHAIIVP